MNITENMKMADVIHMNYSLLPVITRFNIPLGFGDKSVTEVCKECKVNLDFFIEITNSFIDDDYIPQKELNSFPVKLIVDYLHKTHAYYLEEKLPEIFNMISALSEVFDNPEPVHLLKNFFSEYQQELHAHIDREESVILPYVLEIEDSFNSNSVDHGLIEKIKNYSINVFAGEHDNVEEKLYDLKNIIIKYLPPSKDKALSNRILMELFRLEKDLNAHAELEDKVLIPKVAKMEELILQKISKK
ncbi:MAG: hemerythrin domain-containing protein [Bacteroidales bacterium]|nr:hemerythrin domain-containing protein [Bacteroidales bacterium]